MKSKFNPGLILCLIVAAFWLAFLMQPNLKSVVVKPSQKAKPLATAPAPIKPGITVPIVSSTTNLPARLPAGKSERVPVLMYHHVGALQDAAGFDLTVSPADFESQVLYFKNAGYESITVKQLYDSMEGQGSLPKKPIIFTFDDGYKDVFDNAAPILLKYGYTGSFAIATELLGRPTYAVWDDVIAAQKAGMEILSHTENHLDLSSPIYSESDLNREIVDSKKKLEDKLGTPIDFFVYPYGKYNAHVVSLLKEAGYKMAFTTAYGQNMALDNLLSEPRVRVHGGPEGLNKLKLIFEARHNTAAVQTSL